MPKAFEDLSNTSRRRILQRLRPRPNLHAGNNVNNNAVYEGVEGGGVLNNHNAVENNEVVDNQVIPNELFLEAEAVDHDLGRPNGGVPPAHQQDSEASGDSSDNESDASEGGPIDGDEEHDDSGDNDDNVDYEENVSEPEGNEEGEENFSESEGSEEDIPFDFNHLDGRANNVPLYAEAPITIMQSLCLILSLSLKHNLTGSCIRDVMTLINFHCIKRRFRKITWGRYKSFFSFSRVQANKHYFCSSCYKALASQAAQCTCAQGSSYFLQLPLVPQLMKLNQRDGFTQALQHRFQRQKQNVGHTEDIYDGCLYQEHFNNGFLSEPYNISFLWNTDGAPVFKSKNYSIWPFYLTINELPYKQRFERKNVLLAGLWFGSIKPNANLFMASFTRDLERLYQGIQFNIPRNAIPINVRAVLLAGTCDLPAKCKFLNFSQFNTEYGCCNCEFQGTKVRLPSGKSLQVYNYTVNFVKRNPESSKRYATEALPIRDAVRGVKGTTMLANLMPDFIAGTAVDSMHNVAGIVKKILILWFDSKHRNSVFSIRHVLPIVNALLLSLKPPNFIHRMPRSLEDLCHWKSSELVIWLFYYAPTVLRDVVRPDIYIHFMKLVAGLSYLTCSSISNEMIVIADSLLHKFVEGYEAIYGLRHMTMNLHLLLHLADQVRTIGPLWVTSCFPFENLNGILLQSLHGCTNVDSQLARNHWLVLCSAKFLDGLPDGPVRDFCKGSRRKFRVLQRIGHSCYAVGYYLANGQHEILIRQALQSCGINFRKIQKYARLFEGHMMYESESYTRCLQTKSSFCLYFLRRVKYAGKIICFVKVCQICDPGDRCECAGEHYAVVRKIDLVENFQVEYAQNRLPASLDYLYRCYLREEVRAVPVASLFKVCFYMKIENQSFLAEPCHITELR